MSSFLGVLGSRFPVFVCLTGFVRLQRCARTCFDCSDVSELFRDAEGEYLQLEFHATSKYPLKRLVVFELAEVRAKQSEILRQHKIPKWCSASLLVKKEQKPEEEEQEDDAMLPNGKTSELPKKEKTSGNSMKVATSKKKPLEEKAAVGVEHHHADAVPDWAASFR